MTVFQIVLSGKDATKTLRCFKYKTNGTKVIFDNYNVMLNGSISFTLAYKDNDKLLLSIVNTLNICSDYNFDFKVYDLMQNDIDGKKRLVYFK